MEKEKSRMDYKRNRTGIAVLFLWCLLLCGCRELQGYRPIEDIHNLDGRRVGVVLGYSTDYLLTGRDDMALMRYDSTADMLMALRYRRVDAIAAERPTANQIMSSTEGFRIVDPPLQENGFVAYVANGREDLCKKFNAFASEFVETEEYEDLKRRMNAPGVYEEKEVKATGNGETIRIVVVSDNYPYSYQNFETGEFAGSDIEYITYFANAYNYNLEIHGGDYNFMELGVVYEKFDMGISGISDVWRADLEMTQKALVTDIYMDTDVVFVEVEDFDKLRIL